MKLTRHKTRWMVIMTTERRPKLARIEYLFKDYGLLTTGITTFETSAVKTYTRVERKGR